MDDGASDGEAAETFKGFVEDVARIKIGGDEDVGAAFYGGFGKFFVADFGVDSGVELHFAVDEPVGAILSDLIYAKMDFGEVGIFAAGAVGGVRKHSNARLLVSVVLVGGGGVFDDCVELVFVWEFVDAAVGESEDLVGFLADEAAGEIL